MAPTNLEKAVLNRDRYKTNITYFELKLSEHATTPLTLYKAFQYLVSATLFHNKNKENYEKIMLAADPADLLPHSSEYTKTYDRIVELECGFMTIKESPTVAPVVTPPSKSVDIRLLRLELPTFGGNLQEWTSYRDIFKSTVHDNPSLSKVQKMTYLKSTLTGEAARLIQSMSLTNASYDIAWSQLGDRYQNDRELLFYILRRFFNQPMVQAHSSSSLRSLIDVTKETIRSLEALSRPVSMWDDIFLFSMFQKLDQMSRELWEQSLKDSSIPILNEFIEFLEARARALAAGSSSNNKSQPSRHDGGGGGQVKRVHHTQALPKCIACSAGEHPLFRCSRFSAMPVSERFEIVKSNSICYNCLRGGHSCVNCTSSGTC